MLTLFVADAATAPAATTASAAATDAAPLAGQQQPQGFSLMSLLPFILLFGIFYFMMIRPQQRKEKARQKMISELRAGRRVSFAGGLIGTITEAKEQTFVIEICPGSTVEVARGAIAGVLDDAETQTK